MPPVPVVPLNLCGSHSVGHSWMFGFQDAFASLPRMWLFFVVATPLSSFWVAELPWLVRFVVAELFDSEVFLSERRRDV